MSYNLNGSDAFKLLTIFTKDDLGICISWFTEWFEEVVSSFSKFESIGRTNFSTAEAISTIEVFNYLLAEIPRFLEIFLKFCHIDSVEIGSNFVYASCYILRIYFGGSTMTSCLINNQTYCTSKKSILSIEKLHDNGNYLQKCLTRAVGSWPNVRTFAVCLQQKSRNITREIERRKGKFPVLRKFCHNWIVQIVLW